MTGRPRDIFEIGHRRWHMTEKHWQLLILAALIIPAILSSKADALIGGRTDHRDRFTATVKFAGQMDCTAVIIGPAAVVTAGHCIDDAGEGTVELADGSTLPISCNRHPDYNGVNDVALCRLLGGAFSGMNFEVLQTDRSKVSEDSSIVLNGFGCTTPIPDGPQLKLFSWGAAGLRAKSKDPNPPDGAHPEDALMIADGGAVLCSGDSGSAAFDNDDPSSRYVVGIGIRGDSVSKTSWLIQVSDSRILDWFRKWGDEWGSPICGVHSNASGCR